MMSRQRDTCKPWLELWPRIQACRLLDSVTPSKLKVNAQRSVSVTPRKLWLNLWPKVNVCGLLGGRKPCKLRLNLKPKVQDCRLRA